MPRAILISRLSKMVKPSVPFSVSSINGQGMQQDVCTIQMVTMGGETMVGEKKRKS